MKEQRRTPVLALPILLGAAALLALVPGAFAAALSGDELVAELRGGGYVIVMRHAQAEAEAPAPQQRAPANPQGERQLTQDGRNLMTAMRAAFRRLDVRVGDVYAGPELRARETAEYLGHGFRRLQAVDALGLEDPDPERLRAKANTAPAEGRNNVVITHARIAAEAFGEEAADLLEAEALIYRPGEEAPTLVGRLTAEEWALLGRE
jgi:phosphohistidine phosphatase SixA